MLIEHTSLKPLLEPMRDYAIKGMSAMRNEGSAIRTTKVEHYAQAVFTRADELSTCLNSMHIAMDGIVQQSKSTSSRLDIFRYHYENFLLRAVGLYDRAIRLAGAVIEIPDKDLESLKCNKQVIDGLTRLDEIQIERRLKELNSMLVNKRQVRNMVTHSSAFSSRELSLFNAIECFQPKGLEICEVQELITEYFEDKVDEMKLFLLEVESLLNGLIDDLGPVISRYVEGNA